LSNTVKVVQESGLIQVSKDQRNIVVELTDLVRIEKMRGDISTLDVYTAPTYMRDFTTACDILGRMIAEAQKALDSATMDAKHEEAKAKLDRATEYFQANGTLDKMKDSNALRDTYVQLDPIYRAAKERESSLKALVSYLENKLSCYKMDHYTVKAMYDKFTSSPEESVGMKSGGKMGISNDK
jgi:hypothetical protein